MAARTKFMIAAGFAVAGLSLIGAGAGATFTTEVSANTQITSGGVGLSLDGRTGSDVTLDMGDNISSQFAPITRDLMLKNVGTLDMTSTYLRVTASGCHEGVDAPLVQALQVKLTDVTDELEIYDGPLCSLVGSVSDASTVAAQGFITPRRHAGVGGQLPRPLVVGRSRLYRIVVQSKGTDGLPTAAQSSKTSAKLVFSGFDS
jgi:hypothetical protein